MYQSIQNSVKEIEFLIKKCESDFGHISGSNRIKRKLESEKKFLLSLKESDIKLKEASLKCLNLINLKAVVKQVESLDNVVAIFKSFKDKSNNSLSVDIVYDYGYKWVKVLARNPQSLHFKFYCEHDIEVIRQAEQYLSFSENNKFNYKTPIVYFHFSNGITKPLADHLSKFVNITGEIVDVEEQILEKLKLYNDDSSDEDSDEESDDEITKTLKNNNKKIIQLENKNVNNNNNDLETTKETTPNEIDVLDEEIYENTNLAIDNQLYRDINKINLDVSTLIAIVSDLSNGYENIKFENDYLNQQAQSEREKPLLPVLEEFLKGKELYVCETAYNDFINIVYTVGGKRERERCEKLKQRFQIIPDNPSEKANKLIVNKKVKLRTKTIFGTGESLRAVTTTSNLHFLRAACNQGANFPVFLHSPRALTEQKIERLMTQK